MDGSMDQMDQEPVGARGAWYGPESGPWQAPWQARWQAGWRGPWQSRWSGPWQRPWWGQGPMWGRRFGFGPGRGPRGWYPEMGRRFPFGGGPGPRMFERGYLKYALLDLLRDQPKFIEIEPGELEYEGLSTGKWTLPVLSVLF